MKIAVIGGGSTYTPELVDGVARLTGGMKVSEVALVDPDESRLAVVGPLAARIMARYGHPARVTRTADLDEGLDGAGAVLLQLRVGGQATRHRDETWPLDCGCVGQETVGAGGLAKALRTVPVVLDIAERARRRAAAMPGSSISPTPWVSSPRRCSTPVTAPSACATWRSASSVGSPAILGVAPERVGLDHVGLNHLTWERAVLGRRRRPAARAARGRTLRRTRGRDGMPLSSCAADRRHPVVLPAVFY